jgi:hypothetical protein
MHATEHGFFALYDLTVAALIHFTTTVSANVEARLNGNTDQISETLEQASTELLALFREFKNLFFFLAYGLVRVFH